MDVRRGKAPISTRRVFLKEGAEIAIAGGSRPLALQLLKPPPAGPPPRLSRRETSSPTTANLSLEPEPSPLTEELPHDSRRWASVAGLDETSALIPQAPMPTKTHARYEDEPARHKLLDLIGDLYLSGVPIRLLNVSSTQEAATPAQHKPPAMLKQATLP